MKKLIAAVVLVLLVAGIAWAWVDTACVKRCMDAGGLYHRCVRICENE